MSARTVFSPIWGLLISVLFLQGCQEQVSEQPKEALIRPAKIVTAQKPVHQPNVCILVRSRLRLSPI